MDNQGTRLVGEQVTYADVPDDTNPPSPKASISKRKFNALVQRVASLEEDYSKFKEDEWQILKDEYEEKIDKYDNDIKKLYKKVTYEIVYFLLNYFLQTIYEAQPFHKNFHDEFKQIKTKNMLYEDKFE